MLKFIPWDMVIVIINLIVLYVVMRLVLIKPIRNIIEKREEIINSGLRNAELSEKNAKAMELELQEKLDNAKAQSADMIEKARKDAGDEYVKLVSEANNEAQRIVNNARKSMEDEREKAIRELESQIAGIAIDTTKKVLQSSDLSGINHSLYEKFLTESGDENESKGN